MATENTSDEVINILVGVTGSVAAIKLPILVEKLQEIPKAHVKIVATQNSFHFFDRNSIPVQIYEDKDEWETWKKIGDSVLHIELRRWAELFLIAPLDANTMAKLSRGLCDNLLTSVARAWDPVKPVFYCPAMNTHMWQHPLTREHLEKLKSLKYIQIPPISKTLACGDCGIGAMAEVSMIVDTIRKALRR
ncbi:LOW QUALITY PROTEIN: phosphopantothenoylcysteine decarboxylase-like [Dendronephthya gigantea]|uniref:LOW QUALITY PROTEIN: phosphopantothenoylcysteine decarboxylase-like n=1 Tax=Dendronephthya gigantea TaxID=151771 RepID=UPI001069B290|nr:LOW QUALITY PROTEIN: phosphopantothenoylcysteine decarboxylase-like [Dendronephthya gigantea]